jgi:hypothetical protein
VIAGRVGGRTVRAHPQLVLGQLTVLPFGGDSAIATSVKRCLTDETLATPSPSLIPLSHG